MDIVSTIAAFSGSHDWDRSTIVGVGRTLAPPFTQHVGHNWACSFVLLYQPHISCPSTGCDRGGIGGVSSERMVCSSPTGSRRIWFWATGCLCGVDWPCHCSVSSLPLVRPSESDSEGLVAFLPLRWDRMDYTRLCSHSRT